MELIISRYSKSIESKVMDMIGETLSSGRRAVIIVPSQASFLMEKKIIETHGGFCDAEVMSFEKLTSTILEREGGCALPRTDSIGTGIRIRRILEERSDELLLFSPENDEELHAHLAASYSSLCAEGITPVELSSMAANATGQLSLKLKDMALTSEQAQMIVSDMDNKQEAVDALMGLGFGEAQAAEAVEAVSVLADNTEELVVKVWNTQYGKAKS